MRSNPLAALGLWLLSAMFACALAAPVPVVAAESTYGTIAQAIGGPYVRVTSIIQNPNVDPHLFEASPQTARTVARAAVVIMNGLGYDAWMRGMLAANPKPGRVVLIAAELGAPIVMANKNPHVFYDPRVGLLVAQHLARHLETLDPVHASDFQRNLQAFTQSLQPVDAAIARLRARHPHLAVTATEPLFDYMLSRLDWKSLGEAFQLNVMNGTEPTPRVVAHYEDNLRHRRVALLIYNRQVSDPLTQRMRDAARARGIPTVGLDEFAPPGTGYAQWLLVSLRAVQEALHKDAR